jgi:hypothetical protein
VLVYEGESALVEARRFYRRQQPHALDHIARGATNVHRLAARAWRLPPQPAPWQCYATKASFLRSRALARWSPNGSHERAAIARALMLI